MDAAKKLLQEWNQRQEERKQNVEFYVPKMTWGEVETWLNKALMQNPNIKVTIN